MKRVRTRFAPSPTGYMHIGNLRTALYAYLFAKANDGDFILRIEDTDQNRYVADAVDFIKNTLKAAGLTPDEGPDIGGSFGPYVQSERKDIYKKYAEELIESGHAYRCFCKEGEGHNEGFGGYNRACRELDAKTIEEKLNAGEPYVIRQKMPLDGETTFFDVVHGNITIKNDTIEDQVLLKKDGMPTYNFANVVDDHLMEVSHIIRGAEFITSTPKHVLLYQFFGWEPPAFVHLPPVMGKGEDGSVSKLSKRHGATSFSELLDMGYLAEAVTNYVALLGWSPKSNREIFSLSEMAEHFSLDGLSKSPAVFDYAKLDWFNGEYFKAMSDEEFAASSLPFAGEITERVKDNWQMLAALLKTRVARYGEIASQIDFFKELKDYDAALFNNKKNKVTPEKAAEILPAALEALNEVSEWSFEKIDEKLKAYIENSGMKMGTVMWPLRIALSGRSVTPGGVTELLYLLGAEISRERIQKGIDKLAKA